MLRSGKHQITKKEVDEIIGETFELRAPTKEEEEVIATHECGHALLPGATPPENVSIEGVEDTAISGYTMHERRQRDHVQTRGELTAEIGVLLGGRAAERVVFGEITREGDRLVRRRGSEATEARIDRAVDTILNGALSRVVELLVEQRAVLDDMATRLPEKRALEKEDIKTFLVRQGFAVVWHEVAKV